MRILAYRAVPILFLQKFTLTDLFLASYARLDQDSTSKFDMDRLVVLGVSVRSPGSNQSMTSAPYSPSVELAYGNGKDNNNDVDPSERIGGEARRTH